jgi:hypothetical protein
MRATGRFGRVAPILGVLVDAVAVFARASRIMQVPFKVPDSFPQHRKRTQPIENEIEKG